MSKVVAFALALATLLGGDPRNLGERKFPISVKVTPRMATFRLGEPLLCDVTISNGLAWEIGLSTFSLAPNDWNGETAPLSLVDIYREPDPVSRPADWMPHIGNVIVEGMARYPIKPGGSLSILVDLRKWKLVGGWTSGRYRVDMRVNHIGLDSYSNVSVMSDLAEFIIR